MKLKKEYIILIVLIVGLVFYLTMRSANDNDGELPRPEKLESARIDRLVLVKDSNKIELDKKDDQWILEKSGYRADNTKAQKMVDALADLTLTALVSESSSYERYGLSANEKTLVKAYIDGKAVRQINVGKAAPTYQHTFVLLEGDPNVYHARGQIENTFDVTVDSLRDKTVFDIDKETIGAITFRKGEETLTLAKKEIPAEKPEGDAGPDSDKTGETPPPTPEIQWQKPDGQAVDKAKVEGLIGTIAKLNCDGFVNEKEDKELGQAAWTVTFNAGDKEYNLSAFAKASEDADQMPATASTVAYPFYLKKWRVDKFEKSIKELLGIQEENQDEK